MGVVGVGEMSKVSQLPPRSPCVAIFNGLRNATQPGRINIFANEFVRVVEVRVGKQRELAVEHFGRDTKWPITRYEGTWEKVEI